MPDDPFTQPQQGVSEYLSLLRKFPRLTPPKPPAPPRRITPATAVAFTVGGLLGVSLALVGGFPVAATVGGLIAFTACCSLVHRGYTLWVTTRAEAPPPFLSFLERTRAYLADEEFQGDCLGRPGGRATREARPDYLLWAFDVIHEARGSASARKRRPERSSR